MEFIDLELRRDRGDEAMVFINAAQDNVSSLA